MGGALIITMLIGRIWDLDFRFWGETMQRPELMSQLVQSLTPSTKGQKPQAWHFNQMPCILKTILREEKNIYYMLREKK